MCAFFDGFRFLRVSARFVVASRREGVSSVRLGAIGSSPPLGGFVVVSLSMVLCTQGLHVEIRAGGRQLNGDIRKRKKEGS